MKKKITTLLSLLCFGIGGSAFSAGFGVSDQTAPDAEMGSQTAPLSTHEAVEKLLKKNKDSDAGSDSDAEAARDSVSDQAFAGMAHNIVPLTPEQIKILHYKLDKSQRAAADDPGDAPPRPTSSSMAVDLSPGATPPVLRLHRGYITSLNVLDVTGAAWPIQAISVGDPKHFNVQWNHTGNTLLIQSQTTYGSGNLAVILKGFDTPVMMTLMSGQQNMDYRVDLRLPGMGPNAQPDMQGMPSTSNPNLMSFLDGVPPQDAQALVVSGDDRQSQAWLQGSKIYLRTQYAVLSPAWSATMSSADGTHVYELPKVPVVLASERGAMIKLKIEGL